MISHLLLSTLGEKKLSKRISAPKNNKGKKYNPSKL